MKKIREIVSSQVEPSREDLWIKNGKIYRYGPNGWTCISGNIEELEKAINELELSVDDKLKLKQDIDKLATINGQSLTNGGNLTIGAEGTIVIEQELTESPKNVPSSKGVLDELRKDNIAGTGKGLMSDAEKTKLKGIEEGAEVNVVTSVSGKTGAVTLDKTNVGLGNVDNTSDADKPISNPTKDAIRNGDVKIKGGNNKDLFIAVGATYNEQDNKFEYRGSSYSEKEMTNLFVSGSMMTEASKYGIYIDYAHEGNVTRTGNMALHRVIGGLPVQNNIIAGYLTDDGKFTPIDWNSRDIVKDGSRGQMMARIPEHYYNFTEDENGLQIDLSINPSKGAIKVPLHYVGMYEASVARDTDTLASVVNRTENYRGGNNQADRDTQENTLLGRPVTSKSLTSFRTSAKKRGNGWIDYDEFVHADLAMLFYIEYGTLNVQKSVNGELTAEGFRQGGLGSGVTNLSGSAWDTFSGYYPFIPCGYSDTLGNRSGSIDYVMPASYNEAAGGGEHTTYVPRYHCIENPFGHIYKWVDGVLINIESGDTGRSIVYACRDIDKMASTITEDYEGVGDIARANGYVKKIICGKYGILMTRETGGSSNSYFCDYSYTSIPNDGTSLRALSVGGHASYGARAGFAYSISTDSPSYTSAFIGSRLCFFPENYDNTIIL